MINKPIAKLTIAKYWARGGLETPIITNRTALATKYKKITCTRGIGPKTIL